MQQDTGTPDPSEVTIMIGPRATIYPGTGMIAQIIDGMGLFHQIAPSAYKRLDLAYYPTLQAVYRARSDFRLGKSEDAQRSEQLLADLTRAINVRLPRWLRWGLGGIDGRELGIWLAPAAEMTEDDITAAAQGLGVSRFQVVQRDPADFPGYVTVRLDTVSVYDPDDPSDGSLGQF